MIHPAFSLDGKTFHESELLRISQGHLNDQSLPGCERALYQFLQSWLDDSRYIRVQTSGSTGKPKEIQLEKSHMLASAHLTGDYFGLTPGKTALLCLPLRFIGGKMMVVRALVRGLQLITSVPRGNPLLGINPAKPIDFAAMVPAQVYSALSDEQTAAVLTNIQALIVGGGEIPAGLEERLRHFPNAIYATYGMTETITHVAVRQISGENRDSVYHAMPGVSFSQDGRGCLIIRAAHLGEQTIITNDIVDLKSPASFEFLGRYDHVINSGGVKIFPEQVERKIEGLIPGRYYITSEKDDRLGQRVVLVIEGSPWDDTAELTDRLARNLEPHERPRSILFKEDFPETVTGKVCRLPVQ